MPDMQPSAGKRTAPTQGAAETKRCLNGATRCLCIRRAGIGPVLVPDVDCKATHAEPVK